MIFDIIQTKTSFNMEWRAQAGDVVIAQAEAPFMPNMFLAEVRCDGEIRKIINDPSDKSFGTSLIDRLTFRIYDADRYVGFIRGNTKRVKGFFASYPYYEYVDGDVTYTMYEVGFGSKGLYLCIYRDEELLAVVEKDLVTVNFADKYICYLSDESQALIVTTAVIYYDVVSYGDFMNIAVYSKKKSVVNTYQKELKAKFDASFIDKVKANN